MSMRPFILVSFCGILLAGCDQLGIETPAQVAAAKQAEGRAIGSACRHSGRALEDCYALNKRASKAAIFSGWRDMDAYMRENEIEIVTPVGVGAPTPKAPAEGESAPAEGEGAPAKSESAASAETAPEAELPKPGPGGRMA